jgi:hypothetical protein
MVPKRLYTPLCKKSTVGAKYVKGRKTLLKIYNRISKFGIMK